MATISVCMIVKNEEKQLRRCLESIKDLADELIIVDTGSIDMTVEIASEYTENVYHFPWCDDFSAARNESLKHATCDWILVIDADEELDQRFIPAIRSVVEKTDRNAIIIDCLNQTKHGWSKHQMDRIFRRGFVHYEGRVHNQAIYDGDALPTTIQLRHYGYNLSPEEMAAKYRRTEALLKKSLEENPESAFSWRNLIRIYRAQERYDDVINAVKDTLILDMSDQTYTMIMVDMIDSLSQLGQYEEAAGYGLTLMQQQPDSIDGSYYLARAYYELEEFPRSIRYLRQYLDLMADAKNHPRCDSQIVDTWGHETRALRLLGAMHLRMGEPKEALSAYRVAMDIELTVVTFTFGDVADAMILTQAARGADLENHGAEFVQFMRHFLDMTA